MAANGVPEADLRLTEGLDGEREELESVLSSLAFSRAPSLSHFLRFVCEKRFQGDSDSLKEYVIGLEALDRGSEFDPEIDSIVRVEASRVRRRLEEFYRTEGADHRLQIRLPSGSYVPQFVPSSELGADEGATDKKSSLDGEPAATEQASGVASRRPAIRLRKVALGVGAVALVLVGIGIGGQLNSAYVSSRQEAETLPAAPDSEFGAPAGVAAADAVVRILVGSESPKYMDVTGRVWQGDRFFRGGTVVSRPGQLILRTMDPYLYRTARQGDFTYDIPLEPGVYELHLHFTEIALGTDRLDSGGDGARRFDISINGRQAIRGFDIISDAAGPNIADELVFTDVSPAEDGYLHLGFTSVVEKALLSGLEIYEGTRGKMRPIRLLAGARQFFDNQGRYWMADRYFMGGRVNVRRTTVEASDASGLHITERWGHFSYAIPVAPGLYTLRLYFSESNFGLRDRGLREARPGGVGNRLFDVYCNGEALIRELDVFRETGGADRPLVKTFYGIKPSPQGKLLLQFVPIKDYAVINAIEVIAE